MRSHCRTAVIRSVWIRLRDPRHIQRLHQILNLFGTPGHTHECAELEKRADKQRTKATHRRHQAPPGAQDECLREDLGGRWSAECERRSVEGDVNARRGLGGNRRQEHVCEQRGSRSELDAERSRRDRGHRGRNDDHEADDRYDRTLAAPIGFSRFWSGPAPQPSSDRAKL